MTTFPGYALPAELIALREQIRRIVRDELLPIEQRIDPDAPEIPEEDFRRLAAKTKAAGLWCLGAPEGVWRRRALQVNPHLQVNPMPDEILTEIADGVATVTLNRPEKRNAMSAALLRGLRSSFDALDADARVRVVVVRGAGRAFCSGMDLREMGERRGAADPENGVTEILQRVERSRHPTIAMVHGDAIAGGCELALHCDLRIAAEPARLGMPLVRIGLLVPFPLLQKLVEIIGSAGTRELLFIGKPVTAQRALELGMVHQVVPAAEIESTTMALARTIAGHAPLSLTGIKAGLLRAVSLRDQIDHRDIDELARQAHQSADAAEGRQAMLEKRPPAFRGK